MTECVLCQIAASQVPSKKVYEDDKIIAVLDFMGTMPGHCFVMPKEHFTILEQVPDEEIGRIFEVANMVSSALFEVLEVQGTNLFVSNGVAAGQKVPHFFCHVIPRVDGDPVNLQWDSKQLSEEEMSTVELKLKEQIKDVVSFKEGRSRAGQVENKPRTITITKEEGGEGEENYLIKQLKRVP